MIVKLLKSFSLHISGEPQPTGGERPRGFVGGLWYELGEMQFKFLVEHGLRPEHVLLDIACGSLRAEVRLIPYLNSGNYFGIDIDGSLIEHGRNVEIGRILCEIKKPEFVVSGIFDFKKFSKYPDFVMAQPLFTHLIERDITLCLRNLREHCKDDTIFYATFFEVDMPVINPPQSHPHDAFRYTKSEMELIGRQTGWEMEYVGDWGHPRNQKMLQYHPI